MLISTLIHSYHFKKFPNLLNLAAADLLSTTAYFSLHHHHLFSILHGTTVCSPPSLFSRDMNATMIHQLLNHQHRHLMTTIMSPSLVSTTTVLISILKPRLFQILNFDLWFPNDFVLFLTFSIWSAGCSLFYSESFSNVLENKKFYI